MKIRGIFVAIHISLNPVNLVNPVKFVKKTEDRSQETE